MTPSTIQTPITTINLLQLNCHRSPAVFHSLFNDPTTTNRHVIMIQEPAVYPKSGLPMPNPNWVQYLPSLPPPIDPNSPLIPPRCRCVTYINKSIRNHLISQSHSQSSIVVALQLKYDPNSPPFHLINAYLPPAHTDVVKTLSPALDLASSGPILLGMDSNLHHPTWNPPTYTHTHKAAEDLILLAASHHLTLRSELGTPTFYSASDKSTDTTIDLLWANEEAHELTKTCVTDVSM